MVPESLKAVALWYDKTAVPTPPTTSDELLAAVKDGSVKVGINQGVYHQFGWTGAFGGTLMDDTGKCTADAGGFAEAFAYLKSLKDAGATFNTDGNALKTDFQTGKINAIIDGPWQTADFRTALADKLAVTHDPGRTVRPPRIRSPAPTAGTSTPTSTPRSRQLAVNVALALTAPAAEQVFVDDAGHVPANPAVTHHRSDHAGLRRRRGRRPAPAAERRVRQLVGPVRRRAEQGHRHRCRPGNGRRRRLQAHERGERPLGPPLDGSAGASTGRPRSLPERARPP